MEIDWPDTIDLAEVPMLEQEDAPGLAGSALSDDGFLPDARLVTISDQLVLAFPADLASFAIRDAFIARFAALSTIRGFEDDETNVAQLAARARADEQLLGNLLRNFGYYDGQVIRTLEPVADGDALPRVRFDLVPGPRYRFGRIDLGTWAIAHDASGLKGAFGIEVGDPLDNDRIVAGQVDLGGALAEAGYPFAEIDPPNLLIDHERSEGDLTMPVSPNGRYRFGAVVSGDPDFLSSSHLARIARFNRGDMYQRSLETDLRRAITATGLVSSVAISLRESAPPSPGVPGMVDLDVAMTPAPLRTIAGAIGYGSEEGIRAQASWEHRNLFPPEGSLRIRGTIGTREQLAGVTFRKNNFRRRDQILTVDAYASSVETEAFDAETLALRGSLERVSNLLFQKDLSWQVGAEVLTSDERNRVIAGIPRPRQTFFIGSLFGEATIDDTDSLLDPTEGFRLRGFAAPEVSRTSGQTSFYVRAQADASAYRKVTESVVLAGRLRAATVTGAERSAIAPSRRLYAGGGGSVRGYGYQAIGPVNALGEIIGGRSLLEASLEARIKTGFFSGALSLVPFFDLGSVSSDTVPDFKSIKYGAGLGLRYETGFGPIRVDVGAPINPGPQDSPVAVYVSLGQAF